MSLYLSIPPTEAGYTTSLTIDIEFLKQPGIYEVHSASDSGYEGNIIEGTYTYPDNSDRCKPLQRVDIETCEWLVPRPDGKLPDA